MHARLDVRVLILAGGEGRRVGNRDKGLIQWRKKPLVQHVIDRMAPQARALAISCNRNVDQYARFGLPLLSDFRKDFQGPLAGLESAIDFSGDSYLVVVPCDTPLLPGDLATRLLQPLWSGRGGLEISYANDGCRDHYLCAAIRPGVLDSVSAVLDAGERSVKDWYARRKTVTVDFSDQREAFVNVNRLD